MIDEERQRFARRLRETANEVERLRAALRAVADYVPGGDHQAVLETVRRALERQARRPAMEVFRGYCLMLPVALAFWVMIITLIAQWLRG